MSDPFAVQPRIEPETSNWLAHWKRKKTTQKISLVTMFLLASWFTVQWYGQMDSPMALMQAALSWVVTVHGFLSGPKEQEPPIALELNHPLSGPAEPSKSELG